MRNRVRCNGLWASENFNGRMRQVSPRAEMKKAASGFRPESVGSGSLLVAALLW